MSEQLPSRITLEGLALSPAEQRAFPRWYTDLLLRKRSESVAIGDVLSFLDNFGISHADKMEISRMFSGGQLVTLDPPQFYVFLRLTSHILQGKQLRRELAFVAAPVPRPRSILARKGHKSRPSNGSGKDMDSFMSLMMTGKSNGVGKRKKRVSFDSKPPQVTEAAHRSMGELMRQNDLQEQLHMLPLAPAPPPPSEPERPQHSEPEADLPIANNQFTKVNIDSVLHNGQSILPEPPAPRKAKAGDSYIQQLTQQHSGQPLAPQTPTTPSSFQNQHSQKPTPVPPRPRGSFNTALQSQGTGGSLQPQGTGGSLQPQGTGGGIQPQGTGGGLYPQGTGGFQSTIQPQGSGGFQPSGGINPQSTGGFQPTGIRSQSTGGFQPQSTGGFQNSGIQPQLASGLPSQGTGMQPNGIQSNMFSSGMSSGVMPQSNMQSNLQSGIQSNLRPSVTGPSGSFLQPTPPPPRMSSSVSPQVSGVNGMPMNMNTMQHPQHQLQSGPYMGTQPQMQTSLQNMQSQFSNSQPGISHNNGAPQQQSAPQQPGMQFLNSVQAPSAYHITPPPQYVRNNNQSFNMQQLQDQMPNW